MTHFDNFYKTDRSKTLAEKYWQYQKNESFLTYHNSFLSVIPVQLRYQILELSFSETFYRFKLFFGVKDNFRYYVCLHIQPRIYSEKTYLIREDSIPNEIFFVESGEVTVRIEKDSYVQSVYIYKRNTFFGGFFIIFKKLCFVNYIVTSFAKGFAIPGKVLKKVGKLFPSQFELIKKICLKKAAIIIRRMIDNHSQFIDQSKIINYLSWIEMMKQNMQKKVDDAQTNMIKAKKLELASNVLNELKENLEYLVNEVNLKQKELKIIDV